MRSIKFRGRTKEGIWVYGHLTEFYYPDNIKPRVCFIWEQSEDRYRIEKTQVDPDTVGQFTGIVDKKGNEIYEGDVVQVNDKNQYGKTKKMKYAIEFINGAFMCMLIDSKYPNIYPKSMKNQPNMTIVKQV